MRSCTSQIRYPTGRWRPLSCESKTSKTQNKKVTVDCTPELCEPQATRGRAASPQRRRILTARWLSTELQMTLLVARSPLSWWHQLIECTADRTEAGVLPNGSTLSSYRCSVNCKRGAAPAPSWLSKLVIVLLLIGAAVVASLDPEPQDASDREELGNEVRRGSGGRRGSWR